MDELVEGQKLVYVLSEKEAESMNQFIANHPDNQPAGTKAYAGQRLPATVILTRSPKNAGEERLTVRLDTTTPTARSYHVSASDVEYKDGAWHKIEGRE